MKAVWSPRHTALALVAVGGAVAFYSLSLPARAKKQNAACQSALKNIGLSTMQYVRDYDELFMHASNWKEALAPYGKFYSKSTSQWAGWGAITCVTTGREYAFNDALSGATIDLVKNPQTMVLFYEPSHSVDADGGQSWATEGIHGEGSNVCFHDGHVKWVKNKPTFWVPEIATKAAVKRRRDEESRRILQRLKARERQMNLDAKRRKQRAKSP